ncbi:MAG: protein kinase [Polyangiaceae bacterium]
MKICPRCNLRFSDDTQTCVLHDRETLLPFEDPRLGSMVGGRYLIEGIVGEGGMATVYRARQKPSDRLVALKILNPMLMTDAKVVERFRREARHAARLTHPNIIEIFELGETEDGTVFIAMELLEGELLASVVNEGPVELTRAFSIMIQCARGIARAHDLGVIHRDLKPENIFLCKTALPEGLVSNSNTQTLEQVKLLDFGIARANSDSRLTGQGELFGTPQYMSPERIKGHDAAPGDDLYALGCLFYELMTGQMVFEAPDVGTYFVKHLREPPPSARAKNPAVTPGLEDLIQRLLAKDAKARPVDAHSLEAELLLLAGVTTVHIPDSGLAPIEPAPMTQRETSGTVWEERIRIYREMLARAFGELGLAPKVLADHEKALAELLVQRAEVDASRLPVHANLTQVDMSERENRQRFGSAVEALGQDASKARAELRDAEVRIEELHAAKETEKKKYRKLLDEALREEGRVAFSNPTKTLADAYRKLAAQVDEWRTSLSAAAELEELVQSKKRAVTDLEFQIDALRSALSKDEERHDADREKARQELVAVDRKAAEIETAMNTASRELLAALKGRSELDGLFAELDKLERKSLSVLPPPQMVAAAAAPA